MAWARKGLFLLLTAVGRCLQVQGSCEVEWLGFSERLKNEAVTTLQVSLLLKSAGGWKI